MEGLEASVAKASELERTSRLDAEFFKKSYVRSAELIANWKRKSVQELAHVSDGNHFTISDAFVHSGIPYYRGQDVTNRFFAETASPICITQEAYDRKYMQRSYLTRGDVLLSIVGTIGELSLVASDSPATCSCKLAILRPRKIAPEFLAVFLRSEHGQNQIERLTRGAVQKGLILEDMDQLWVPDISERFEKRISEVVLDARTLQEASVGKIEEAESVLLDALGLTGWTPPEPVSFEAKASDVLAARRLDAQYFRPLFEEVEQRLQAAGTAVDLGRVLAVNARGRQPLYDEDGLPVVNSKHVRANKVILDDNRTATEAGSPVVISHGDVLINGTGVGTIGRTAAYLHHERALPDNHVTVLRTDELDPVFLSAFLNSSLGQWQIERHIKGSSGQIELYPADIARIKVWDAPQSLQKTIRKSILSAFDAERRSKTLLDTAKRAVEIAIEQDESAALEWLEVTREAI